MERLRAVARATGVEPNFLIQDAAAALTALGADPAGMVTACRRLVERHPSVGPMWWLTSRVLTAADPVAEAWRVSAEMEADTTPAALAAALPDAATVVVVGWPDQVVEGMRRRGDAEVLLVAGGGESAGLARRLRAAGVQVHDVADAGLGAAVLDADLVVLEACALGPDGFVATPGSRAAAAVARAASVPAWVVAGVGRVVPAGLWPAVQATLHRPTLPPWDRPHELVPIDLCDRLVGPSGVRSPSAEGGQGDFPVAPELLKPLS